jgi:hypothetical protein
MSKTDKIEIPHKILQKFKSLNVDFVNNTPTLSVGLLEASKISIFSKIKKTIMDYLIFLKNFIKKSVNIVEILYILRPLIYLGLMIVFKKKSFIPLLVNFIIDLIIIKTNKRQNENFEQQKAYAYEYMHRLGRLGIYFLREPIFSVITKPFIRKLMKILRFPTFLCDVIMALLSYYNNFYFIL